MSIGSNTSLIYVNTNAVQSLTLPPLNENQTRVLQCKSYGDGTQLLSLTCDGTDTFQPAGITSFSNTFHYPNVTLQASRGIVSTEWNWNQFYFETGNNFQSNVTPSGTIVPISPSARTFLTVDLRTEAKVIVLPPVASVNSAPSDSRLLILKDKYGNAQRNAFYISTSGGDILESVEYGGAIRITDNYGCIQLIANSATNTWNILSYYDGNQVQK